MPNKTLSNMKRRLQKLQEQEALYGYNTPPEVLLEIEDLTERIATMQSVAPEPDAARQEPASGGSNAQKTGGISVAASGVGSIAIGSVGGDVINR